MGQVYQRVRPALPVVRRAARADETHPLIESHGAFVLLVYVRRHAGMQGQSMPYQRRADPLPKSRRGDKQGFHMPLIDQHETKRAILGIDRQHERHLGEKATDLLAERDTILGGEERVRRIDRIPPDVQDTVAIGGTGRPDTQGGWGIPIEAGFGKAIGNQGMDNSTLAAVGSSRPIKIASS